MTLVRPDVPASLAARPWDERRNLPIPVVSMFEGKPNFAAINGQVAVNLASQRRCGLCGDPLTYWVAFLGGAQAAAAGTYGDPPMHVDCAEAAVRLCPHIALSHHRRVSEARHEQLANGTPVTVAQGWVEDKPAQWAQAVRRSAATGGRRSAVVGRRRSSPGLI